MANRNQRRINSKIFKLNSLDIPTSKEIEHVVNLFKQRSYLEAELHATKMTKLYPAFGFGWKILGVVLKSQGRSEDSLEPIQRAAVLLPSDAEAQSNLGVAYKELGRLEEAEASYRCAIKIKPDFAEAYNNLGVIHKERGAWAEAESCYRHALEINPYIADVHSNLGAVLNDLGRLREAEVCHRRALQINPHFDKAEFNLGNTLNDLGRILEAETCYRRALKINSNYAEAYCNLGALLKDLGQYDEAEISCRRALEIRPDFAEAHSVLLFILNYASRHQPMNRLEEARKFGQMVSQRVSVPYSSWYCRFNTERLRVGIVSGDLYSHPVGYFLESLLAKIDPTKVEFIAYPTDCRADDLTERIRPYFSGWKTLVGFGDEAAARRIHADGVHLLLDLSGHTAHNRLSMFAWKPAPIQASWLGYFATTGVEEMDYLLADETGVPLLQHENFTESIWYLPDSRLCFSPPGVDLDVSELPALKLGQVTFGCYQNLAKVGDEVLAAWSQILGRASGTQLRLQCRQLGDPDVVKKFTLRILQHGIDPSRISLYGAVPRADYLATFAEVDLVLDTFPYPGGTTTCEALWMGVPTVTLVGESLLSRQGASILAAAGLPDYIAESNLDYVSKAVAVARAVTELAALRAVLRQKVLDSPLFDASRFARNFEGALLGMWKKWLNCQKNPACQ